MTTFSTVLAAVLMSCALTMKAYAMAGDLKHPSIAMPAGTPQDVRTRLLAALSEPGYKFLDGHFINANTTLHYGGAALSLNRMLANLSHCAGVELNVTFTKGEPNGPTWTVNHSGWGAPMRFEVEVNVAASALDVTLLSITLTGREPPNVLGTTEAAGSNAPPPVERPRLGTAKQPTSEDK